MLIDWILYSLSALNVCTFSYIFYKLFRASSNVSQPTITVINPPNSLRTQISNNAGNITGTNDDNPDRDLYY